MGCGDAFFYTMLSKFEPTCLDAQMDEIIPFIDGNNFKKVMEIGHKIKGSSAYIGAGRIHYACFFI